METTTTVMFYLVGSAVLLAALVYAFSLIYAIRQPKVVSRMAIRRQLHNTYLDMDWNILATDDFEDAVKKTVNAIDMSGVAFEKVKADFEEEQARKRAEGPTGPYNDPTQMEASRQTSSKKKKKRR